MNIKFCIVIILIVVSFSSCYTHEYLPTANKIDENPSGSFIDVKRKSTINFSGELIAVDSNKIIILSQFDDTCMAININDIKRFKLRYAKAKHYGWSIPLLVGLPVIHGFYSILTIPTHLIITTAVTVSGEHAYRYKNKDLPYTDLKMFARFPQGVPSNIKIENIKHLQFKNL